MLIIVPYIIENNDQAEDVTRAITRQLKSIAPAALSPAPLKGAVKGGAAPDPGRQ